MDRVKILDVLPGRGMLGNILSESLSTGGAPANVLASLAKLEAPFPLAGVGVVGDDQNGRYILDAFGKLGVDVANIRVSNTAATSYTDVITEKGTGDRAFFHYRGANALFEPNHVAVERLSCRIFHLGSMELVAVHMPEGVYIRDASNQQYSRGSLKLPRGFIKSAVGAGDAFCAGMLYGLHERWDYPDAVQLGTCCAACSLSESGATDGMRPLARTLELARRFAEREPPVKI